MNIQTVKEVKIIKKTIESLKKNSSSISNISLYDIARELGMEFEELTYFFKSVEEIILSEQVRVIKELEDYFIKGMEKAKTANDYKDVFDGYFDKLLEILPENAEVVTAVTFYLPACLEQRTIGKAILRKLIKKIIKKGWPGKVEMVLERQTDLVLLSLYGFHDYMSKVSRKERKIVVHDFKNMLNLHLQDRLFF